MMYLRKTIPSAIVLVLTFQLVCFGTVRINPNDDVTLRGSTNYNASSPFGLFVKNSNDVSYMEYTLGSVAVTEAKLVLHNDDPGVSNPWTIVVKGDEFSFDETTFNTTFAGSGWPQVGTIPNVMAVDFYEMDLTDWYNDNLGKTMSLFMTRDTQPGGSGPIFEDREGTKTGDALTYGPRLELEGEGGNRAPFVNAGADQEFIWPDDSTTLAAEIQDDGDPNEVLKYWWEVTGQPAGSNVNLTNPTGLGPFQITVKEGGDVEPNQPYAVTPTVKVDQSGIYELRLNVRDEKSDSNDTVRIFVYPAGYEGLAAHWKLDDGIDTGPTTLIAEDSSGSLDPNLITYLIERHYHNGDLINKTGPSEPNWTSGVDSPLTLQDFKGALWFDGVDDYVEIPSEDGLQLTKNFTISAWIYPRTVGDYMTIISKVTNTSNKQYFLWVKDSAELEYGFEAGGGNDGGEDGGEVVAGEWQHVAVTMDSDLFITLYINGSVVDTKQETLTPEIRDDNINIGRFGGSYEDRYFDGYIDDVRIYPEAKSNEEIIVIAGIENPPPTVDAGDSYHTWLGDLPLTTLAGTVGDGPPGDVADAGVAWSITGTPEGANATVEKTSTLPEEWANPTADFTTDTVGTYEITLRATDATELTGSDTLEIQVWSDACEAAQEAPSWTGFNIFDTDQNCVVDLIDYAAFAAQWLADLRLTTPEAY